MELSFDQIRKYFEVRHPGQRIPAREKVAVLCAHHSENNPSCTLFLDGNGGFHCNACGAKGNIFQFEALYSKCDMHQAEINIAEITGARPSSYSNLGPPVALYDYRDENCKTLFQKRRYEPEMEAKTFRIFRPTDRGWVAKIDPDDGAKTRRVLFNLPDLIKANVVFICEGEKDCINLGNAKLFPSAGIAITSTTSFDGAWTQGQSPKWLDSYNPYFTGKKVFIFQDNDASGKVYAETIAAGISKFAYDTRIVTFPELADKGDVSDYLESHSPAELEAKIKAATVWQGVSSVRENWLVEAVVWAMTANAEIEWLVDGVIQVGANGIIAAEPKTGKSLCALDLLISLACGCPWMGRKVARRVRSAYVSREDSPALTKVRIQGLLRGKGLSVDPTGWLWCNTREQLGDFDVDNEDQLKNMAHDLKERGVEFAIFDVLNRLHNRSENDNTEMAQVVQKISRIGQEAGCAIGLVHHVSKENGYGGRFFTRIRGASAIHGWTEWSIGLSIENADNEKRLIRKAEFETKAAESCYPISFTINHGGGNLSLSPLTAEEKVYEPTYATRMPYRD